MHFLNDYYLDYKKESSKWERKRRERERERERVREREGG
jgi:hypothetical protein